MDCRLRPKRPTESENFRPDSLLTNFPYWCKSSTPISIKEVRPLAAPVALVSQQLHKCQTRPGTCVLRWCVSRADTRRSSAGLAMLQPNNDASQLQARKEQKLRRAYITGNCRAADTDVQKSCSQCTRSCKNILWGSRIGVGYRCHQKQRIGHAVSWTKRGTR